MVKIMVLFIFYLIPLFSLDPFRVDLGARVQSGDIGVDDKNANHGKITDNDDFSYSWQKSDTSLALLIGERIIWQLNYGNPNNKPYFHPLNTCNGHNLTWLRPPDHPWHYGLWFSWKFINSKNYWEENVKTRLSEGKSTILNVSNILSKDFSATVQMDIVYFSIADSVLLLENRMIWISPPDSNGNYSIDWSLNFKSQSVPVILDRTPPEYKGGPKYGGYAGLSFRASKHMKEHKYMDSQKWVSQNELVGQGKKARWMDLTGVVDGAGTRSGVTMFNHPQNGENKIPWYIYKKKNFAFYNAGLLFHGPIKIPPNDVLNLKYRVLVHSRELTISEIDEHYKRYATSIVRNKD